MQKLLFQIFLIVCFMVYLKKYVNEHEKIYGIANIVLYILAFTYYLHIYDLWYVKIYKIRESQPFKVFVTF